MSDGNSSVVATAFSRTCWRGGLGAYVVEGFAIQDFTLLTAGAIPTAALAIATEGILALVQRSDAKGAAGIATLLEACNESAPIARPSTWCGDGSGVNVGRQRVWPIR